ncbi:SAM-dependent methyltransferase, type 11 [Syntrophotalea carbinolica DSM 2380]|uniref:SAM-dependent methyltransferase, type 11 n=1 Tax=Syntrophotalea carbinolica (strain DSM 2380 / NBRC 103641 / GraBd1) TaxID=338963 RepID=Q3A150_SYNC1|nr:class I SAM-dependent methyltransferase [Syntrophotalea carbinolica]ABA89907.1 SAM-dependent methyltransferase, type 11 [Syntrophotalea carbinolica DSM 2380]
MSQSKCDHGHKHRGKSSEHLVEKEKIIANLSIQPGQKVLDAGCGNGYMAKEFARQVGSSGRVYALDPDACSIRRLKEEIQGTVIEPFVDDITKQTKLAPDSIDLIYLSTVLHGFTAAQMQDFVVEVKRLLKPGGILAIVEIKKGETPFGPPQNKRLSPEELANTLGMRSIGLVEVGQHFYMQRFRIKDLPPTY